jgi:hypothetical protein
LSGQAAHGLTIRSRIVVAGVVLLGVPAVFTIFPEMTRWSLVARIVVAFFWVAVVAGTLVLGAERDAQVGGIIATTGRQREQLRRQATDDILSALTGERPTGMPGNYRFTVYLFDPEANVLLPIFPEPSTGPDDIRAFPPGKGATGMAYTQMKLFLVTGEAVYDDTWGLTVEQQQRWADYRTVVATPIWSEGDQPKGVLSAISREEDGFFDDPTAQARLREIADVIGVVLVDVSRKG